MVVAARLIGLLARARRVDLDTAEDDLIVLRVGPEIGQRPDDRWPGQLLDEVQRMLLDRVFDGWEPEIA